MTRPSPTVVSGHADPAGLSVGPPRGATRPPAAAPGPGAGPAAFVGQLALVAVAYFAAARAGLALATVADQVTIVWPSAGIALGALVLFGYRAWPAVTVGAFLANAAHAPAATAGAIAIGNTLEALAGAWMLRRLAGFDAALERVKDVLGLLVLAAGLSTTVSATVGVTTLCATGVRPWSDYSLLWGVWWMGDAMGDLVVAPLLLTWAGWRRLPWGPWRVPEVVALVGGVLAVSVSVFAEPYALVGHPAMAYALFPFMIWAALRFGPPVAALATALASALAVQGTVLGYGPYQAATVLESLILVQLFMAVVATTTLVLAAVTTERARAENSVRQGYALLRAVIDGTTDAVFVKDREGRYLMINGAGAEFLGKTVAQVLGQDDTRLFSPETARAIMEADGRIMATGEVHTYEEVGTAAGVTRTYLSTKGPYRDADGTICGMIGISRDITERKQAEERFRLVVESVPTGLVMTDRAGRIVLVNEQTERLFGYGRDELLGRSVEVLVPDGYRACHPAHRAGFFAQPTRRPMGAGREVYGRRRDGSEFPVELGLAPIRTADGVLVLSVIVDIIERKRAEEARARLAAIVELSEDAILSMSLDGVVQTWNRAAEKMYGYSALEILGRPIAPLIPPDRRDEAAANLRQVGQGRRLENHETVRTRKDGTQIDISLSISPLPDASGRVTAVAKIARDITPRKSDERRLAAEHAVTRALAESTNLDGAAPEILRTIGETLGGDLGVLWEVSPDPDRLRCAAVWRPPGQPATEFERHGPRISLARGEGLPGRAWDTGRPAWVPDARFPRSVAAARTGPCGAIAAPLVSGGAVLGAIELFSPELRRLHEPVLAMVSNVATQVGQFIERRRAERLWHAREREFRLAREIQQGLLPRHPPAVPGLEIAGASHPAQETGGDFFDFISLADGTLGVAIGDAAGHGIAAALLIAETRAYLRALALTHADPDAILRHLNSRLAADVSTGHFVTLLLARFGAPAPSLDYSNAGHWPGQVIDARGEVKFVLPSTNLPLGVDAGGDFPTGRRFALDPGDVIVLLSDGIIESPSGHGQQFGMGRAIETVREHRHESPDDIIAALLGRVREWCRTAQEDDMTAVVIKVLG